MHSIVLIKLPLDIQQTIRTRRSAWLASCSRCKAQPVLCHSADCKRYSSIRSDAILPLVLSPSFLHQFCTHFPLPSTHLSTEQPRCVYRPSNEPSAGQGAMNNNGVVTRWCLCGELVFQEVGTREDMVIPGCCGASTYGGFDWCMAPVMISAGGGPRLSKCTHSFHPGIFSLSSSLLPASAIEALFPVSSRNQQPSLSFASPEQHFSTLKNIIPQQR
ncbi:hypothetical protein BDQ12DRAFT_694318 [Crucibulum laeve]|uniref:Uncharacterized protein n=1 Tax=Crucibulum laeve TaxID=68775 RepID=A0A5C3LEZ7_9AGAR|nr:hypothetical protein BDQ12DRAFT_694318 [Crucibulum laeve]